MSGAFGGAALAVPLAEALRGVPALAPYAGPLSFGAVVVAITYLSLIIGELVPKRLALNGAEAVVSRVAGPMRLISAITAPAVWFLSASTEGVLKLLGVRQTGAPAVSEQEVEILMEEGARAGVFEEEERGPCAARTTARRSSRTRADDATTQRSVAGRRRPAGGCPPARQEGGHSFFPVARGDLDDLLGIASVKEAWGRQVPGKPADLLGSLQRSPLVAEGAPVTDALEAFKRSVCPSPS